MVALSAVPIALKIQEIKSASAKDEICKQCEVVL